MVFDKVLIIGISEDKLGRAFWARVDKATKTRLMLPKDSPDIAKELADADCLLVGFGVKVDEQAMESAGRLRYIGTIGTGFGNIDIGCAKSRGIAVCNVPGYATEAVAELAFGAILEHIRDLENAKQKARAGDYSDVPRRPVCEIKGKKFGIIGLGRIGTRVAEIARAFGAEVRYFSRSDKGKTSIDSILTSCDFISINLALNKDTENFLNAERISMIKPGAILLNLAPNELVDFGALDKRLAAGDMVYIADHTDEMTKEQVAQLSRHKNCILYPPIGYQTQEASALKQEIFVANVNNFIAGKTTNRVC